MNLNLARKFMMVDASFSFNEALAVISFILCHVFFSFSSSRSRSIAIKALFSSLDWLSSGFWDKGFVKALSVKEVGMF
jgi:hypothetical protein